MRLEKKPFAHFENCGQFGLIFDVQFRALYSRRNDFDADHFRQNIDKHLRLLFLRTGEVECEVLPVHPIGQWPVIAECPLANKSE